MHHSFVADGVTIREDEKERNHEMRKGQPIGAIGDERIVFVGDFEPFADFENPVCEALVMLRIKIGTSPSEERRQKVEFMKEWKSCDAADDEPKDDKNESDTDSAYFLH